MVSTLWDLDDLEHLVEELVDGYVDEIVDEVVSAIRDAQEPGSGFRDFYYGDGEN